MKQEAPIDLTTIKETPTKPPKGKEDVKLPPVKGYNLDSLGLGDEGDKIMKKAMDHTPVMGGYKNPQTRRYLESIEKKDYGKI